MYEEKCGRRAKAKHNLKNGFYQNVNLKKAGFLNRFLSCDFAVLQSCDLWVVFWLYTLIMVNALSFGICPGYERQIWGYVAAPFAVSAIDIIQFRQVAARF